MNRRQFLSTYKGNKQHAFPENPPSDKGIATYTGAWGFEEASHLLRRTIFGPNLMQMNQVANMDMDAAIELLMIPVALPSLPLTAFTDSDGYSAIGQTWINQPLSMFNTGAYINARRNSLFAWNRRALTKGGLNIREKMTLFWQNHFATGVTDVPEANYRHVNLLRTYATGNFKDLIKAVTKDAHMLNFLNGNENISSEPNENYARELLELYTIGKGPLVAPGDYTNYTEQDVIACAKILTGWSFINENSTEVGQSLEVIFTQANHTLGSKTLSHRFGNKVIAENGATEYIDLIDIIFEQPAVAKYIVTKLYRYFVYYDVTPTVQQNVIDPLAQILIDNDYAIQPVLEVLFKSEHFYDQRSRGCLIKNPIDYLESAYMQLDWQPPTDLVRAYKFSKMFSNYQHSLGMEFFKAPSVAGWKAYYQSPSFHRFWLNPATYQKRDLIKNIFMSGILVEGVNYKFDEITLVQSFSNPNDPDAVVVDFAKLFLPLQISNSLKIYLKTFVLIPGLPDNEWTMEYENYLAHPNDMNLKNSVAKKLNNLIKAFFELPEFQLS